MRSSKRKLQPEAPLHAVSKKLRSKIPRRRRRQISPVLIFSPRFKASGENRNVSVISVDSSSGSDFAGGEVSCNSSRISAVLSSKRSRNEIECVQKEECVSLLRNPRFEKRNENQMEVSETSCVDSNSGVRERSRSLILKFNGGKENDEISEVTCAENSKSSNGNLNITRNDVISVSSGARETSFIDENGTNLKAQSIMKQLPDNSGYDSDLACSEQLQRSYYEDESEYCSSQETTFSDLHSEMFGECSDCSQSLFESGSEFSQGSVGETPSHTYSLLLQYRKEFMTLGYSVTNTSRVEGDASLQCNVRLLASIFELKFTYYNFYC